MTSINKTPELLSPAGSWDCLKAAVNCGANAVYLGGTSFNARRYASNFSDDDLKEVIEYCHLRGVLVRITLNTLYKESEINDVLSFVSRLYSYGADALIVQDIGTAMLIRENFPLIRLHASTQMTLHSLSAIKQMEELGFSRVVLSRELSLDEIKNIVSHTSLEIECFIHGALCVSYSGRCFMSSFIGERSGNRGSCAQPCRMTYDFYSKENNKENIISKGYLLSPRDISCISILNELIDCGISTFKIEGRMKSPEYVAAVTSVYRYAIDNRRSPDEQTLKDLTQIFNRGGYSTTGYYHNWAGTSMLSDSPKSSGIKVGTVKKYDKKTKKCTISLTESLSNGDGIELWTETLPHTGTNISKPVSANDAVTLTIDGKITNGCPVYRSFDKTLDTKLKRLYSSDTRQQLVSAHFSAHIGEKISLSLKSGDISVTIYGLCPEKAQSQPMTKENIISRLSKTGNTPFSFSFETAETDDNIYIPIAELNNLKREAISALTSAITESYTREKTSFSYSHYSKYKKDKKELCISVNTANQLYSALDFPLSRIYLEFTQENISDIGSLVSACHDRGIELFLSLPYIMRDTDSDHYADMISSLENTALDGYLIRNYGIPDTSKKIVSDFTFNIFNSASAEKISKFADIVTLSPELAFKELTTIGIKNSECIIYGRLPVMFTHQCPVGLYIAGKKKGRFCKLKNTGGDYFLKDRMKESYPVMRNCNDCYAYILNSKPVFLPDSKKDISLLSSDFLRLAFTDESPSTVKNIISLYLSLYEDILYLRNCSCPHISDTERNDLINRLEKNGFSKGHYYKSVL
ncbi:MAG: U32 family peptidase [Firmicutes bacterium]|nr:U32 family peptidase [Bacillota bacterium]